MEEARPRDPEQGRWTPRERRGLLLLALLAFGLRLIYVLGLRESPYFEQPVIDPAFHLEWARALARGEAFEPGPFFRAPLYPWFLALCLKLTGGSLLGVRLVQCGLGAATAVLTYLIGRRAFDRRVGALAGLAAATYWVLIYFDGEFLLPTLAVPLNLLALWQTLGLELEEGVEHGRELRPRSVFVAGVLWGLAAITRPNVLLFMPLLALWLLMSRRRSAGTSAPTQGDALGGRSAKPPWVACVLLTLGTLLPILPLTAYNSFVGGDRVLISTQAGVNLWIGNHPGADGRTAKVPGTTSDDFLGTAREAAALAALEAGRPLSPSGVSAHYGAKALAFLIEHPVQALAGLGHKTLLFLRDEEIANNQPVRFFAHHFSPVIRWSPLGFVLLLPLGTLGLLLALGRRRFPLWGLLLTYSVSVVVFFVCSRFRVPVLPLWMVLGSHAVFWVVDRLRAGARRGPVLWAVALTVLVAGSVANRGDRDEARADGLRHLAVGFALAGDIERAAPLLEEALALTPTEPQTLVAYAGVLEDLGRLKGARARLEQAWSVAPSSPLVVDRTLGFLARHGDPAELERWAREALARDESLSSAHYHLGVALLQQRKGTPARASLEVAVRLEGAGSRAQAVLGSLLAGAGQRKRALVLFEQAVDHDAFPNAKRQEEDTRRILIHLLLEAGRGADARARSEQWLSRYPDSQGAQAAAAKVRTAGF